MKVLGRVILVLGLFWLQASFFGALRPWGVVPNVLLVFLIIAITEVTVSEMVGYGVAGGVLLDLASGADFGLRTAFFSFVAIVLAVLTRSGAAFERWSMAIAALVGGTILYNFAVLATLITSQAKLAWPIAIRIVIIELALNLALYASCRWLLRQTVRPLTSQRA
jgi:rod shape-determining protein MreD